MRQDEWANCGCRLQTHPARAGSPCHDSRRPDRGVSMRRTEALEISRSFSRREALWRLGGGLGGIALGAMLGRDGLLAAAPVPGVLSRDGGGGLHFPARAKRVVQLFMSGAASQCDTFDYKPRLIADHGKKW